MTEMPCAIGATSSAINEAERSAGTARRNDSWSGRDAGAAGRDASGRQNTTPTKLNVVIFYCPPFDVNKCITVVANKGYELNAGVGLPTPLDKIGSDNNIIAVSVFEKVPIVFWLSQ